MVLIPLKAHAQAADLDPPVIDLQIVEQGARGDSQVFSATVTDNELIVSVMLHYRFGDSMPYEAIEMSSLSNTSIFTASLETSDEQSDVIQYYVEAVDGAGNRAIQGFAFDPFTRNLVAAAVVANVDPEPALVPSISRNRKILYGVLGLIVVGALASASSDSGASGNNRGSEGPNVPLTVVVDPLQ